jgi:hypothetical protein
MKETTAKISPTAETADIRVESQARSKKRSESYSPSALSTEADKTKFLLKLKDTIWFK